ncbi:TetR/AcrR family transcriptional regulator [Burkholderia multivorans]|uniref:TetR/AcrR family transcriptional regulator n=1 Tax=Burkholderia multivorans TaxID=87883 RepID=UPI00345EC30D
MPSSREKWIASDVAPNGLPEKRRAPKRSTDIVRRLILEAAITLLRSAAVELPSLERVAAYAGVHKMTIYRAFGSREKLTTACVEWLCENELELWKQTVERCRVASGNRLRELFVALAIRIGHDAYTGCQLQKLALQSGDTSHFIQCAVEAYRRELHAFVCNLAKESGVVESERLADALCLVWEGASSPLRSRDERQRLAVSLVSIADRLIASHSV